MLSSPLAATGTPARLPRRVGEAWVPPGGLAEKIAELADDWTAADRLSQNAKRVGLGTLLDRDTRPARGPDTGVGIMVR